jgi:hypothetical protein
VTLLGIQEGGFKEWKHPSDGGRVMGGFTVI